jgi:hypothetical protein
MVMITDFNAPIIPYYSPISSRGGKRKNKNKNKKGYLTKKNKKSKKSKTKKHYFSKMFLL